MSKAKPTVEGYSRACTLRAVLSHRYGFVYVPVTKCGTTTMDRVLQTIHGIDDATIRIDTHSISAFEPGHEIDRDIETLLVSPNRIRAFMDRFSDYIWMSVVRDPYDRLVSMYNYDARRYAKFFEKQAYLYAGLFKRTAFVLGRDPRASQRNAIRRKIAFNQFVRGLEANGTDFDIHFMRQADILMYEVLSYDRLMDVRRLSIDLPPFLRTVGVPEETIERLMPLPRSNPSHPSDASYDETTREMAYRLYQPDFTVLTQAA